MLSQTRVIGSFNIIWRSQLPNGIFAVLLKKAIMSNGVFHSALSQISTWTVDQISRSVPPNATYRGTTLHAGGDGPEKMSRRGIDSPEASDSGWLKPRLWSSGRGGERGRVLILFHIGSKATAVAIISCQLRQTYRRYHGTSDPTVGS